MGISWSYSRQSNQEEDSLFNFLRRRSPQFSGGQSGSRYRNGGPSGRSRGGNWRRMSNNDNEQSNAEPNRPSVESDDYDDREDESIAAILSSLIRSGQFRLISPEGSYTDDVVMEPTGGAASDSSDDPRGAAGDGSRDTGRLKSTDIKTIVDLNSGQYSVCKRTMASRRSIVNRLRVRELGGTTRHSGAPVSGYLTQGDKCYISNHMLPSLMCTIDTYRSKVFCGQYTKDGRVLITACQDHRIRFYDMAELSDSGYARIRSPVTANGPSTPRSNLQFHSVEAKDVGWSILDVAVSPDGRHVVYSSWSDYIHQCNIYGTGDENHAAFHLNPGDDRFCVFSLRFSADGNEILAGANDHSLYIYDRQRNTRALKIAAHEDDVNAVCFADDASNIVYSGGDDGLCKVWDRRTLSEEHPKPVGVLAGHADGITFIDSKGDARYLISNSKDQSIKLWDIRKFSTEDAMTATRKAVANQGWDYRWQNVPRKVLKNKRVDGDTSVMTYQDHHTILHTLIRSFFSPAFTTGQRYVYTGCASGACVVYDVLTGALVKRLKGHHACVRDVSWHPYRNEICTASWDAVVARWTFNGRTDSDCEDDSSESLSEDSSDADDVGYDIGGSARTAAGRLWHLYRRRQAPLRRSERLRELRRRGMPSMRFD